MYKTVCRVCMYYVVVYAHDCILCVCIMHMIVVYYMWCMHMTLCIMCVVYVYDCVCIVCVVYVCDCVCVCTRVCTWRTEQDACLALPGYKGGCSRS